MGPIRPGGTSSREQIPISPWFRQMRTRGDVDDHEVRLWQTDRRDRKDCGFVALLAREFIPGRGPGGTEGVTMNVRSSCRSAGDSTAPGRRGVPITTRVVAVQLFCAILVAGCASAPRQPSRPIVPQAQCDAAPQLIGIAVPVAVNSGIRRGGTTTVAILVDERGVVLDSRLESHSGSPAFDETVLRAVRQARYRPYASDCGQVENWTKIKFSPNRRTPTP